MGFSLKNVPVVVNLASFKLFNQQDGNKVTTDIYSHLLEFDPCSDALDTVDVLHYSSDSRLKQVFRSKPLKTGMKMEKVASVLLDEYRWMYGPECELEQIQQELAEEAQKAEDDDEIWSLDFLYL